MSLITCEKIEQIMVNGYVTGEPTNETGARVMNGDFTDDEIREYMEWNNNRVDNAAYERGVEAQREAYRKESK